MYCTHSINRIKDHIARPALSWLSRVCLVSVANLGSGNSGCLTDARTGNPPPPTCGWLLTTWWDTVAQMFNSLAMVFFPPVSQVAHWYSSCGTCSVYICLWHSTVYLCVSGDRCEIHQWCKTGLVVTQYSIVVVTFFAYQVMYQFSQSLRY